MSSGHSTPLLPSGAAVVLALGFGVCAAQGAPKPKSAKPAEETTPIVKTDKSRRAPESFSSGVDEVARMLDAGVSSDIILKFVQSSSVAYALTPSDVIGLKERNAPDEVTAAMLLRGQRVTSQPKAMPRIVRELSTGGRLDPESYEFWQSHYAYPRALSSAYRQLAPYSPRYGRSYRSGFRHGGPFRFGGPTRIGGRGSGLGRGPRHRR